MSRRVCKRQDGTSQLGPWLLSRATSLLVWLGLYSAAGDENYGRQHLGQEPGAASVERVSRSNLQGAEQEARIQLGLGQQPQHPVSGRAKGKEGGAPK
ncbi:hypothetical protein MRX96_039454 [Rhipicephalus microplus]